MIHGPPHALSFDTTAPGFTSDDFYVRELEGVQALSELFEYRVRFDCAIDGGISPEGIAALLEATASVGYGPNASEVVCGLVRQIELVDIEMDGVRSTYEAVLVPRLWLATQTRRSRCFNEMSIPDIIKAVLTELGWAEGTDFELRLYGDHIARSYVCQYEESDFDFVSRWMERVGIFYYFEQTGEKDVLVLVDSNAALVPATQHPDCTFSQHDQAGIDGAIHALRRRTRRMPANVVVRDYNWRQPAKPVVGEATVDEERGVGLQAFYGDHVRDDAQGTAYARLRAEGFNATKETYGAWSVNADFAPGYHVDVTGAPVGELDGAYLITRVRHTATQDTTTVYKNELDAIALAVPYRAPRVTPWPRIDGVMHARIDAESVSSAAPIDEEGRYRVVLPFDLYGAYGGKATRWIRKAEPYSGASYGMHFTLHVGAEVLLAHIGGDPDRPIIVGSVPSRSTLSPLTSTHATRSAIRTRSGILFDFEDDA
ncbi:MAG: type VI secretion system Vgr family protein [Sandaracinaceae bacterium]